MNVLRRSWLILIGVILLTSACLAVPAYFIYENAKGLIVDELGKNAINIAATAATFIEEDIEAFSALPAYTYNNEMPDDNPDDGFYFDDVYYDDTYYDESYYDDSYYDGTTFDDEAFYDDSDYDYYEYDDSDYDDSDFDDTIYDDAAYDDATYDDTAYDDATYDDTAFDDTAFDDSAADDVSLDGAEVNKSGGLGDAAAAPSDTGEAPPGPDGGTYNEEYFDSLLTLFDKLESETGAENIYTEKRMSDTKKAFVFDDNYVPEERYLSGILTEEELLAFNQGIQTSTDVMTDRKLGEYISGYAPINDINTGKPVGMVVVEFSLEYAENILRSSYIILGASFLVITLLVSFVIFRLVRSRIKYRAKDDLTELCNKRYFEKHLKSAVRSARQTRRPLSLMMIDVDHFKTINDTKGHIAGDNALKSVSQVMLKNTRRNDACSRYGGDEFVITLPNADKTQAAHIAERIRSDVSALELHANGSGIFHITLSIGIAELDGGMNAKALVDCADRSMYVSKNSGKNKITVYSPALNETLHAELPAAEEE